MPIIFPDATCPVCKRNNERIQLIDVPLGHGRYCEYLCCDCKIVFPWGSNKFGDIRSTDQIKEVRDVANALFNEGHNQIAVADHPDFQPYVFCEKCKKDITQLGRLSKGDGKWICSPSCPAK